MLDALLILAGFLLGAAAGVALQAWRTARSTGTTVREQIKLNGGPPPVRR